MALHFVIQRCDPAVAALIMSDALQQMCAGAPIPPLINAMDEARSWAEWASPFEHRAYCLAACEAMPPAARAAFIAYVTAGNRQ